MTLAYVLRQASRITREAVNIEGRISREVQR